MCLSSTAATDFRKCHYSFISEMHKIKFFNSDRVKFIMWWFGKKPNIRDATATVGNFTHSGEIMNSSGQILITSVNNNCQLSKKKKKTNT